MDLIKIAIGLSIGLVVIAYIGPVGLEAIYDTETDEFGYSHVDGEEYRFNDTYGLWQVYNGSGPQWDNTSTREDKKMTGLYKLLPLFVALAVLFTLIKVVEDRY